MTDQQLPSAPPDEIGPELGAGTASASGPTRRPGPDLGRTQKIALIAGGIAAAATLAFSLAVLGAAPATTTLNAAPVSATDPAATPQTVVDTVYLHAPAPTQNPNPIVVPAPQQSQGPVQIIRTVRHASGEHEGHERGDGQGEGND